MDKRKIIGTILCLLCVAAILFLTYKPKRSTLIVGYDKAPSDVMCVASDKLKDIAKAYGIPKGSKWHYIKGSYFKVGNDECFSVYRSDCLDRIDITYDRKAKAVMVQAGDSLKGED